jgi:retron-type reverse transcriptase
MLLLIRRDRQVDVMQDGLTTTVGRVPQGEPLSPLLSNIMLDDLDKELERRQICQGAVPIIAGRCCYEWTLRQRYPQMI